MSKQISFLDRMFWITESEANPKHVAALQVLEIPSDAPDDYVDKLFSELQSFTHAISPFDCKVISFAGFPLKLSSIGQIDVSYHIQLHSLEDIDNKTELHAYISDLHESCLDRAKPLWQYHLIKDSANKHFAIYIKVHHMCGDGASLVRMFQIGYTEQSNQKQFMPVWATQLTERPRKKQHVFKRIIYACWGFVIATVDLIWIVLRLLLKLFQINQDYMPLPFSGTKSILTGQVKKGRVITTLQLDFSRVVALSKRLRVSANEIMLCVFDIGVHRFLKDYGQTPRKALLTNMPINLRQPGETTAGNKIAIVPVKLAYGETDPYLRLRQIIENHRVVKQAAKTAHPGAFSYYTLVIQAFATLFEVSNTSNWVRPIGNILVSNMPGPPNTLYFKDAKLCSSYPLSTMTPGGGVNITMFTYDNKAHIGMVSCASKITSLEPMTSYFEKAFEMLEQSVDDDSLNIDDITIDDIVGREKA